MAGNYKKECPVGKTYWNHLTKDSLASLLLERVLKYRKPINQDGLFRNQCGNRGNKKGFKFSPLPFREL